MKNVDDQEMKNAKPQESIHKSNVKHTSDGEMPDADAHRTDEKWVQKEVEAAYEAAPKASRREVRIPESQGDMADRAEEEIENEIKGRIDRVREESKYPMKDRH